MMSPYALVSFETKESTKREQFLPFWLLHVGAEKMFHIAQRGRNTKKL